MECDTQENFHAITMPLSVCLERIPFGNIPKDLKLIIIPLLPLLKVLQEKPEPSHNQGVQEVGADDKTYGIKQLLSEQPGR